MTLSFILVLGFTTIIGVDSRKYKTARNTETALDWKHHELIRLSHSDQDGLIHGLNTKDFVRLFVDPPRNYTAIVLFTTRHSYCQACYAAQRNFRYLANSYKKYSNTEGSLYFVQIRQEDQYEIVRMVGVGPSNLPVLFYFSSEGSLEGLEDLELTEATDPTRIARWIRSVSGIQIPLERPKVDTVDDDEVADPTVMKYLAIALLLSHIFKYRVFLLQLMIHQTSSVAAVVAIIVICYFTSGHTYNWINNVPFLGRDASSILFVYPEGDMQLGAETFVVFFLYCLTAGSMIVLIEVKKHEHHVWHRWIVMGSLVGTLTGFNLVHKIYSDKMNIQ